MRATARIVAIRRDGRTVLPTLHSQAPLVVRATGPGEVHLVGGAAGPLGGDRLRLEVVVEPGATLMVRTAAAAVLLPGADGSASHLDVDVSVADGAELRWLPEPVVAAHRCRHHATARIRLAAGARLLWRDELVLGRWGEPAGALISRLSIDRDDRPLVRHELVLDAAGATWASPAVGGGHRCAGTLVVVDPSRTPPPDAVLLASRAAVWPLEGPASVVGAVEDDAVVLRARLDAGLATLAEPASAACSPGAGSCIASEAERPLGILQDNP